MMIKTRCFIALFTMWAGCMMPSYAKSEPERINIYVKLPIFECQHGGDVYRLDVFGSDTEEVVLEYVVNGQAQAKNHNSSAYYIMHENLEHSLLFVDQGVWYHFDEQESGHYGGVTGYDIATKRRSHIPCTLTQRSMLRDIDEDHARYLRFMPLPFELELDLAYYD